MIKTRVFPEHNYKAVWFNGKTIRLTLDPTKEITELDYPEFYDVKITGNCKGQCPWCFLPDEKVNTINGLVNIQDIAIDEKVISYDKNRYDVCIGTVDQIHSRRYTGNIVILELENGIRIKATEDHKFFTTNRGWVKAKHLSEDDNLFDI